MSDSDISKFLTQKYKEWSKNNFPREKDLADTIILNFNKFFDRYQIPEEWKVDSSFELGVKNELDNPTKLQLKINGFGMIFLGIMARAILDSLSSEFEALLSGDIANDILEKKVKEILSKNDLVNQKTCPGCHTKNSSTAKYCNGCGNLL